jgi:molybdopterin-guanine dinucleotide biosynthesis protein A
MRPSDSDSDSGSRPGGQAPPLYGLVLAGGRSTRMLRDKASLDYHGRPQTAHTFDLLSAHCRRVFLSCRSEQASEKAFAGLPQIHDSRSDMGPLAGILSALEAYPHAAWLVVACDLPFLGHAALERLIAGRDPSLLATAFASADGQGGHGSHGAGHGPGSGSGKAPLPAAGLPEPLCAIYEPAFQARLIELASQGIHCPRKALLNSPCRILPSPDPLSLSNVNRPEEFRQAREKLSDSRPG